MAREGRFSLRESVGGQERERIASEVCLALETPPSSHELVPDRSRWPVVLYRVKGEYSEQVHRDFIQHTADDLDRRESHVVIIDARHVTTLPTAVQRRELAETLVEWKVSYKWRHAIYIIDFAVKRGVLTAVYWIHSPPYSYDIVSSSAGAHAALVGWLTR